MRDRSERGFRLYPPASSSSSSACRLSAEGFFPAHDSCAIKDRPI